MPTPRGNRAGRSQPGDIAARRCPLELRPGEPVALHQADAQVGQALRILPKGFAAFNRTFLSGTVHKIVQGGRMGILSGSNILVFQKRA